MDLAINQNGNFSVDSRFNGLMVVSGNQEIKQIIYIVMMEAPMDLIIGKQYKTSDDISLIIKNYLEGRIGIYLPFSFDQVEVNVIRNFKEDIQVTISVPNITTDDNTEGVVVNLKYQGREGYLDQLNYNFRPNLASIGPEEKKVIQVVDLKEITNKFILNYEYSGKGAILIYGINDIPVIDSTVIEINLIENQKKYNVNEFLTEDYTVDRVSIIYGESLLEKKTNLTTGIAEYIQYEYGTPYFYSKGTTGKISLKLSYSNAVSYANSTIELNENFNFYVFPLKLTRNKYLAVADISVDPGKYKIIYNALLRYNGALN